MDVWILETGELYDRDHQTQGVFTDHGLAVDEFTKRVDKLGAHSRDMQLNDAGPDGSLWAETSTDYVSLKPHPVITRRPAPAPDAKHACGGPVFGRLTPGCPRCDQLAAGAEPVRWNKRYEVPLAEIAAHDCRACGCGPVCTADQW